MGISTPDLMKKFKGWLSSEVRIDNWTLNDPSSLATKIEGRFYPANTAVMFPPNEMTFEESNFGLVCTATVRFQVKYRFTKNLEYDALPLESAVGIINNIYYNGVLGRSDISEDILEISTPDPGTEVLVSRCEANKESDWLIILNPIFRTTFQVALADVGDMQPGEDTEPIKVNKLEIAIYRAKEGFDPEDPTTFGLDRRWEQL